MYKTCCWLLSMLLHINDYVSKLRWEAKNNVWKIQSTCSYTMFHPKLPFNVFSLHFFFVGFFWRCCRTSWGELEIVKVGVALDSLPMGSLMLPGNEEEEDAGQPETDLKSCYQLSSCCCCYVFGLLSVNNCQNQSNQQNYQNQQTSNQLGINQKLQVDINMVLEVISRANI